MKLIKIKSKEQDTIFISLIVLPVYQSHVLKLRKVYTLPAQCIYVFCMILITNTDYLFRELCSAAISDISQAFGKAGHTELLYK
jgi:hypothetical protein